MTHFMASLALFDMAHHYDMAHHHVLSRAVKDLNKEPVLPYPDASFDVITNCVSVDYLSQPLEVSLKIGFHWSSAGVSSFNAFVNDHNQPHVHHLLKTRFFIQSAYIPLPRSPCHESHDTHLHPTHTSSFLPRSYHSCASHTSHNMPLSPSFLAQVFREMHRVLKPGGTAYMSFSNRCFPTKAIQLWTNTGDADHVSVGQV